MTFNHSDERAAKLQTWKRNRDFCSGVDAVKRRAQAYLPKPFSDWDAQKFNEHINATQFFPASSKTLANHTSLIFRKNYTLNASDRLVELADRLSPSGQTLGEIAKWCLREYLITNDGGLVVDYSTREIDGPLTLARDASRPFVVAYPAESILEIDKKVTDGHIEITRVVLQESDDQYRVLEVIDGQYTVTRYDEQNITTTVPLRDGQPLSFIPFIHLSDGREQEAYSDIVATNLTHYALSGQLQATLKWVSNPIPYIAGIENGDDMTSAPGVLWTFRDPAVKVGYLEISGNSIASLERQLASVKDTLAELGGRILQREAAPAESVEITQRREAAEQSILAQYAQHIENCIQRALQVASFWMIEADYPSFYINKDFSNAEMTAEQINALIALYQQGLINDEDLYKKLRNGEVIGDDVSLEQYLNRENEGSLLDA